jgi:hypothetical protein
MGNRRPPTAVLMKRIVVPLLIVIVLAGGMTAYYFFRVTGNALRMPQQLNRDTYAVAKYFYWQSPYPTPVYRSKAMSEFYGGAELEQFREARTLSGPRSSDRGKSRAILDFLHRGGAEDPALCSCHAWRATAVRGFWSSQLFSVWK